MREGNAGRRTVLGRILTKLLALVLLVAGAIAIIVSVAQGLGRPHFGMALILGVGLGLGLLRGKGIDYTSESKEPASTPSPILRRLAPSGILIAAAPVVWVVSGGQDLFFFLAGAVGAGLLVPYLLSSRTRREGLAGLVVIVVLNLVLLWRSLQFSDGPIGVDPWFHVSIIRDAWTVGNIPTAAGAYQTFPHFHLEGVQIIATTGLRPFDVLRLMSFLVVLTPIFVFLAARNLVSERTALLATLILAMSDYFLFWQTWIIPMSLGIMFFAAFVWSLTRLRRTNSAAMRILILLLMAALILVHPIATLLAIVTLSSFHFTRWMTTPKAKGGGEPSFAGMLTVLGVGTLAWWILSTGGASVDPVAHTVLALRRVLETFNVGEVGSITRSAELSYFTLFLRDLGVTVMLSLFPAGTFLMLRRYRVPVETPARLGFQATFFLGVPLLFGVGGQFLLFPDRWFVFGYVSASVLAATALLGAWTLHKRSFVRGALCAILATIIFGMVSSPIGAVANPLLQEGTQVRQYYTDAELTAASFLGKLNGECSYISDLRYTGHVLRFWHGYQNPVLPLTPEVTLPPTVTDCGALVVRTALQKEPVLVALGPTLAYYEPLPEELWLQLNSSSWVNRVYANGDVWVGLVDAP